MLKCELCKLANNHQASRYKIFVGPFTKVFLGAIFTYQVIYWTWLKLEMDEAKVEKNRMFFLPSFLSFFFFFLISRHIAI